MNYTRTIPITPWVAKDIQALFDQPTIPLLDRNYSIDGHVYYFIAEFDDGLKAEIFVRLADGDYCLDPILLTPNDITNCRVLPYTNQLLEPMVFSYHGNTYSVAFEIQ
jgi:hypothetical protein